MTPRLSTYKGFTNVGSGSGTPILLEEANRQMAPVGTDEFIGELLIDPGFEQGVKEMVEGKMAEFVFRVFREASMGTDSPFGSIYISDLTPDLFDARHLAMIKTFENIEDLSESISFDDHWED